MRLFCSGKHLGTGAQKIKNVLKWIGLTIASILGLAFIAVVGIYVYIGVDLNQSYELGATTIEIPDDAESVAEGERLARLRGCNNGCHGETSGGDVFAALPDGSLIVAPNLYRFAQENSAEQFELAVRRGIGRDGTGLVGFMPASMFYHLSDEEIGNIIAYLRSQPAGGNDDLGETKFGPLGRVLLFIFKQDTGQFLAPDFVNHDAPRLDPGLEGGVARGQYLATTSCTECHGEDFGGEPESSTPDLIAVLAYSLPDFRHLMRTGQPADNRELDLMAEMSRKRFSNFTDAEIDALYAFLQTLPARRARE